MVIADIDWDAYEAIDKTDLLMEAYHLVQKLGADAWQLNKAEIGILNKHTQLNVQPAVEKELFFKLFRIATDEQDPEGKWLFASDAGYGFVARLADAITDRKAGKTMLNVPENSFALAPAAVPGADALVAIACVDGEGENGRLLVFPIGEVPEMPRGKGNKLFNIPAALAKERSEVVAGIAVVPPGGKLLVLEFSKVAAPLTKAYDWYSFEVLPRLGKMVAGDEASYRYLAESIRMHPDQQSLKALMQQSGFAHVDIHNLSLGVVALHVGIRC